MEIDNAEQNTTNPIIDIETIQKISCRLVIKNIPENLSSAHLYDIFEKNFAENIKDKSLVIKLEKKYSLKKRNKIFFVTANNLQTRDKIYEFFSTFELIDPKGIKQKLVVNDCLMQSKIKGKEDIHHNTLENCEHFQKFKEYFNKNKLVEFKAEEDKFCDSIYEDIKEEETNLKNAMLNNVNTNGRNALLNKINANMNTGHNNNTNCNENSNALPKKGKMIILKKDDNENIGITMPKNEPSKEEQTVQVQETGNASEQQAPETNVTSDGIEIIRESSSSGKFNKERGYRNNNYYRGGNNHYYYGNGYDDGYDGYYKGSKNYRGGGGGGKGRYAYKYSKQKK